MRIGAGQFKGRKLPEARGARPISARLKTSLFSVLEPDLPDAAVLDLCAGVGALGFEALSRGALSVVLVDRDAAAVAALGAWIKQVGVRSARAVVGDWLAGALPEGPFDLVFLDPPFEVWDDPDDAWVTGFERIRARLADDGLLAVKVPARFRGPSVAGWRELRRQSAASSAYVILAPEAQ